MRNFTKTLSLLLGILWSASTLSAQTPGNCLAFDGINDYITLPSNAALNFSGSSSFTIAAWVYPVTGNAALLLKQGVIRYNVQYAFHISGSKVFFNTDVLNANGWQVFSSNAFIPNNQWTHIAVVKNGSSVSIYINGQLDGTNTLDANHTNATASSGAVSVGGNNGWISNTPQKLDEVSIWSKAFSLSEIQGLYAVAPTGSETGLIAAYNFSSSNGTVLTDISPNAINGTLTNFALSGSASNWTLAWRALPANNISKTGFTANWPDVAGATNYRIDISDKSDFSNLIVNNANAGTNLNYIATGLTANIHYYRVRYVDANGISENTQAVKIEIAPGNCLEFDGVDDVVSCGVQNPTTFTMEAWFNASVNSRDQAILSTFNESSYAGCELHLGANGIMYFTIKGTANVDVPTSAAIQPNTWNHVAVTYNGSNVIVYINGILSGTAQVTGYVPGSSNLKIGQRSVNVTASIFKGKIDEVRVWNIARTESDIQQSMFKELVGNEAGLLSYYNFNQTSGLVLNEAKGAYVGTIASFPTWTSSAVFCPFVNDANNIRPSGFTANWVPYLNATTYKIDVDDNSDFTSPLITDFDCGNVTTKNIPVPLSEGINYYYRIRAVTANGTSSNSEAKLFALTPQNALAFDGANDYVFVPQIAVNLNEITIETWINLTLGSTGAAGMYGIFNTDAWVDRSLHYQINTAGVQFALHGNSVHPTFPYLFSPNTWYHTAVTFSSTTKDAKFYVNGTLVQTVNIPVTTLVNLYNASIGCWHNPGVSINRFFNGKMDDYRIWNKALSQAEIQARMNSGLTGSEANLLLYFNFNQGIAFDNNAALNKLLDASYRKQIGTLTNFDLSGSVSNYVNGFDAPIVYNATNVTSTGFTANIKAVAGATKYRIDVSDKKDFSTLLINSYDAGTNTNVALSLALKPGVNYYYRARYEAATGESYNSNVNPFMLQAGNAIAMDGANDYVNISNRNWNLSKVTLETWVYCNVNTSSSTQFLTSKGSEKLEMHIGNGLNNSLRFIPTPGVYFDAPVNSLIPNQWNHIACSYDPTNSSNNKIYINGTSVTIAKAGSNPVTTPLVNDNTNFHLGARVGVGLHFNGIMDEVRVWNLIRSESEIQNNMYSSLAGNETGIVAYYNFNQGAAGVANVGLTAIPDLTGNGNNGTLYGSALVGTTSNYVTSPIYNFILDATSVSAAGTGFTANWNPMPGATGYLIDVANNPEFTAPIITDSPSAAGTASKSISGLSLVAGYSYYYRMRYTTATGTSSYSETKLLSYGTAMYNASKVTSTDFTANWKAVAGATKYRIDVSDKSDFSNLLANNVDAGVGTSKTITGLNLALGTNYYYRMRYEISAVTSGNSLAKTFMLGAGNSLSFDGADDYVNMGTLSPTGNFSTGFTYMGWVKYNSFNNWSRLFDFGKGQDSYNILLANNTTTNNLYLANRIGTAETHVEATTKLPIGQWIHIAATISTTGTGVLYINGQNVASGSISVPSNEIRTSCYLSKSNWPSDGYFNGNMDNVSIWNRALSAAEIQNLQDSTFIGNETGLVAFYDFNQGVPNGYNKLLTTLSDATGACNGQLSNFALENERGSNYAYSGQSINVFYVKADAVNGGNGLTPTSAFNNLNAAFAAATGRDTIKVAAGIYYQPAFDKSFTNNSNSLTLLGGYNNSFTARDIVANKTIISGLSGATVPIINILYCDFTIDGFTIKNGISNIEGGAIKYDAKDKIYNINVSNCEFLNNKTTSGHGGAIWMNTSNTNSQANISNCKFIGNSAGSWGGALINESFKLVISNCFFDGNTARNGGGGAIYTYKGTLNLSGSTFVNNEAINVAGGALLNQATTSSMITNNTFYNNRTNQSAGAIWTGSWSTTTMAHNTIVGNFSSHASSTGAVECESGPLKLLGNIIAGNFSNNVGAYDLWRNANGTIVDEGYNIFGTNGLAGHTPDSKSFTVNSDQLYNILESANQSNTAARLFPAKVTNNGGSTPTIKVIGRVLKNSGGSFVGIRTVPNTYSVFTDQKGTARLLGNATIGAYESEIPQSEKIIYVNGNLSNLGDGRTPASAYNNLQAAFATCTEADTIKVAAGTYTQPSTVIAFGNYGVKNIIVYGGYKADFTARDTAQYRSTLQANTGSVVPILWIIDGNFTIDGFTIKDGKATAYPYEGGAIHFHTTTSYTLNVSNCLFTNNRQSQGNGGVIWALTQNASSVVNLTNCTFMNNLAEGNGGCGGVISALFATFNITGCSFINNSSTNVGGAIYFDRVTAVIKNSTFFGNRTNTNAGAIWAGDQTAGVASNITLIHNTIVGNFNSQITGAGAICCARGLMSLQGNIIAGNFSNIGTPVAYDVWQEQGAVTDNGYNIFGTNGTNVLTVNANSIVIANDQLYRILESSNQTNTSARLFPAKVANNGGATATVKVIGKYFNNSTGIEKNIRQVPAVVNAITMPTTDQRGIARTSGAACIGAYETNPADKYIYVNANAASDGIGTFENPCKYLYTAIAKASVTDTILVAAGTYSAPDTSFVINKPLTLMGGFNASFSQHDPKTYVSYIQYYSGNAPLVKIKNASAEINGFTLLNAQSTTLGGAVVVSITNNTSYNVVFKNCIFNSNKASNGGGICLDATLGLTNISNVTVSHCTFSSNSVTAYGGGVSSSGKFNTSIKNCTFFNNSSALNGGAIYQGQEGTMLLKQNTIVGNSCTTTSAGGGVACNAGTISLLANIIAKNNSSANKHNVYKVSGTVTDKGYNLLGTEGSNCMVAATGTDSLSNAQLDLLLTTSALANYGGHTPTMKLLKKDFTNVASALKYVNIVPAEVGGIVLETTDQRGVNRIGGASCIGAFEYRDTLQVKHITVGALTATSASFHFTPGSFSQRVVFIKNDNAASAELPINGTTYTANSVFGSGTQIASSGWYCVYNGSDTVFSVTGLNPVQTYVVKAYEYNDVAYYHTVVGVNNPKSFETPQKTQHINFSIESKNWGDADFSLPDSTNLGLRPVIYESSNTSVASISGNMVHITGVGTTIITAKHDGNSIIAAAPLVSRNLIVKADTLFITAANTSGIYGETQTFNFNASGLRNNDSIIAQVGVTYTSLAKDTSSVGTYDVTPSAVVFATGRGFASNYILKYSKGTHTIQQAVLIVKADNKSKQYGNANPSLTAVITGFKNSDIATVSSIATNAIESSELGSYSIIPSDITFTKGNITNYSVTYQNGTLTITPASLTIKANDKSKAYFSSNPIFDYTCTGFVNGETDVVLTSKPQLSCLATKTSVAGTYPITLSGASASNYSITYQSGTLTVLPSTIQLCLITVDMESGKNMVIWERQKGMGIKSYNVYRETNTANQYEKIDSLLATENSVFIDPTAIPEQQRYSYKISAVDSSDNESVQSKYHKNLFLQSSVSSSKDAVNLSWKKYEIEGNELNFESYIIYKGSSAATLESITTLSANEDVYIDRTDLITKPYYRIAGVKKDACVVTKLKANSGPFSHSISNLEDNRLRSDGTGLTQLGNIQFIVAPNPARDQLNIYFKFLENAKSEIEILDASGRMVYRKSMTGSQTTIDLKVHKISKGFYYIRLKQRDVFLIKQFVVQ